MPIPFGARFTPQVQLSRIRPGDIRQGGSAVPVRESHGFAGSWTHDHGVAANLRLQRVHLRSDAGGCLGDSPFWIDLCGLSGVGLTSGCTNLVFVRVSLGKHSLIPRDEQHSSECNRFDEKRIGGIRSATSSSEGGRFRTARTLSGVHGCRQTSCRPRTTNDAASGLVITARSSEQAVR